MLLLIFLAGSTGITFYVHTCGSNHQKEVFIYREIFHQKSDCCCEDNPAPKSPSGSSSSIDDGDCCKIAHLFIKALLAGFPVLEKVSILPSQFTGFIDVSELSPAIVHNSKAAFSLSPDPSPPPPIFGITLLHYLHQLRLPSAIC
jgi:hypothetical protein